MGSLQCTRKNTGQAQTLVEGYIDQKINSYGLGNLQSLLVAGIAFKNQVGCLGIFQNLYAVKKLDGFGVNQGRADCLSTP